MPSIFQVTSNFTQKVAERFACFEGSNDFAIAKVTSMSGASPVYTQQMQPAAPVGSMMYAPAPVNYVGECPKGKKVGKSGDEILPIYIGII